MNDTGPGREAEPAAVLAAAVERASAEAQAMLADYAKLMPAAPQLAPASAPVVAGAPAAGWLSGTSGVWGNVAATAAGVAAGIGAETGAGTGTARGSRSPCSLAMAPARLRRSR